MILACWSEDFSLHPRADDPERVSDYITEEAAQAGGGRIEGVRVLAPPVLLAEVLLAVLVQREVDGMEQGDTEDGDWITYTTDGDKMYGDY